MAMIKVNMDGETPWATANKIAARLGQQQGETEAATRRMMQGDLEGDYDDDEAQKLRFLQAQGKQNLEYLGAQQDFQRERDQFMLDNSGTPGLSGSRRYGSAGGGQPATEMEALKAAIRRNESDGSGGYNALGPVTKSGDRAYGAYQVMGNNIPEWTEKYAGRRMTPQEFLKDQQAQEQVFEGSMGENLKKHGNVRDAISVWFTGSPYAAAVARGANDGYTGVQGYVSKAEASLRNGIPGSRRYAGGKGPSVAQQKFDLAQQQAALPDPIGNTKNENGWYTDKDGREYEYHGVSLSELNQIKAGGNQIGGIDPTTVVPEPRLKSRDGKMMARFYVTPPAAPTGVATQPAPSKVAVADTPPPTAAPIVPPQAQPVAVEPPLNEEHNSFGG